MLIFSGKGVLFLLRNIILCENRNTTGSATHTHTHTHTQEYIFLGSDICMVQLFAVGY